MNNKKDVKDMNISAVLQCIKKKAAISKGKISAELGITTVTSHKLVFELCNLGLVKESGEYVSYGGKKAALYMIDPDFGLMIGIAIKRSSIFICVCNMGLDIKFMTEFEADIKNAEQTLEALTKNLTNIIRKFSNNNNILGIGVSIPGRASDTGDIIYIPGFSEWEQIRLGNILHKKFNLPVFIDNDANALALSVKWKETDEVYDNFVCSQIVNGIGVGVITNGELFKGEHFLGSEIGHMTLDPNGELCSCGKRGCLQTFVSENKVLKKLKKIYGINFTYNDALELLRKNDNQTVDAFKEYLDYLKITIDNMISVYAPKAVFIFNEAASALPGFEKTLQSPYFKENQQTDRKRPKVKLINEEALQKCASCCILFEQIMKKPLNFTNKSIRPLEETK